ncbi:MAG: helix-turn-helix transcriptional regulator [Wolinella sp.]
MRFNTDTLAKELTNGTLCEFETQGASFRYIHHQFEGFHVNVLDYHMAQEMEFFSEIPYSGCDLLFTLKGEALLNSDYQNIKYTADQLIVSNTKHVHASLHVDTGVMKSFSVGVSDEFLNKFCRDSFDFNENVILKNTGIDPVSRLYIEQILHADHSDPLSKIYIQSKALDIIYMNFRDLRGSLLSQKGIIFDEYDKRALLRAKDILSYELRNPPSIRELSKRVRLNEFKLKLGFKQFFTQTPYEFLRDVRMKIALDLVQNSEMSLTEISAHIGLKSQSYFSKLFYQYYKVLPRDVMKRRNYYFLERNEWESNGVKRET